jgi:hypothetical protein
MCLDPVTMAAISAGITGLQAVTGYAAQSDAADAQALKINQERASARMDAERAQQQAYEQAAGEANAHSMKAASDMALFDAIAGENGGGVSSQRGAAAIGIQNGQDLATINSNARKGQSEIGFGDLAAGNRATQSLAAIRQPSLLEAGLTIAGAGVSYGNSMNKIKTSTGKT